MSRVGRKLIPLPNGVKVQIGDELRVEGPKGKLTVPIPPGIKVQQNDGQLELVRESDIVGVGYRADVKGKVATFTLGYSHPIEVLLPDGVDLKIDKQTHLVLSGYDRQMLGQVAANIRALRKPDPYKNKGIRYTGEVLRKKVGKTGASGK
jgi:large subunit ribosomal protein L6